MKIKSNSIHKLAIYHANIMFSIRYKLKRNIKLTIEESAYLDKWENRPRLNVKITGLDR